MKIRYWCDSGANAYSRLERTITLDEIGLTESEWRAMTANRRDNYMREIALDRFEWGYSEVDE